MSGSPDVDGRPNEATVVVDVGVTAYRRTTYLDDAIRSVLGQTFGRWRLTICDNGPGGGEIERAVQPYLDDPRVSYLATGRELPLAENWTNALRGTAPYVTLLNDDDRWHPGFLQARVEALEAHPECGFAFSEWVQIDERGTDVWRPPIRTAEGVLPHLQAVHWFIRHNPVVPSAILIRRSACDAVGAYFDGSWQYCDWELWARLVARYNVFYLSRHDNDYRRHSTTYTLAAREPPDQLLGMFDHLEQLFTSEVDGFELGRAERARMRSQILLRAAGDVHAGAGWKSSGDTYRRALREYPPTFFDPVSLTMIAKSLLGQRGSRLVSRALRPVRSRSSRASSA